MTIRDKINETGMSILRYKEAGLELTVTLALHIMAKANRIARLTLVKGAKNPLTTFLSNVSELTYTMKVYFFNM